MPGRHDPEVGGDFHRRKLGLRQTHPILVFHPAHTQQLAAFKKVLRLQQRTGLIGLLLLSEQSHDARALPAILGRRHARFTKQRLFGGRLGVGIFHRHTQGVEGVKRITEEFDPVLRAQQHELEHQRLCWLSQCSR